jgi:transposase-like protein
MNAPSCESKEVIKRGFDDTKPARQRYACHNCDKRFDDLTDTIFAGRLSLYTAVNSEAVKSNGHRFPVR